MNSKGKNPSEVIFKNTACVALGMTLPSLDLGPLISKTPTTKSTSPIARRCMSMILFYHRNINVG